MGTAEARRGINEQIPIVFYSSKTALQLRDPIDCSPVVLLISEVGRSDGVMDLVVIRG